MSPETQRIAIAEACGWTNISVGPIRGLQGTVPKEQGFHFDAIPDYLGDLNAMHEAEMSQTDNFRGRTRAQLYLMYPEGHCGEALHATAAQRVQALLRTLGLWKE